MNLGQSKFTLEQRVKGNGILTMNCLVIIKDIISPQNGQRGFIYQVRWDDNSQSEEFERNLWASNEPRLAESDDEVDDFDEAQDDDDDASEPPQLIK